MFWVQNSDMTLFGYNKSTVTPIRWNSSSATAEEADGRGEMAGKLRNDDIIRFCSLNNNGEKKLFRTETSVWKSVERRTRRQKREKCVWGGYNNWRGGIEARKNNLYFYFIWFKSVLWNRRLLRILNKAQRWAQNKAQRREITAHLQNDAVKRRRVIKSSRLVKKEERERDRFVCCRFGHCEEWWSRQVRMLRIYSVLFTPLILLLQLIWRFALSLFFFGESGWILNVLLRPSFGRSPTCTLFSLSSLLWFRYSLTYSNYNFWICDSRVVSLDCLWICFTISSLDCPDMFFFSMIRYCWIGNWFRSKNLLMNAPITLNCNALFVVQMGYASVSCFIHLKIEWNGKVWCIFQSSERMKHLLRFVSWLAEKRSWISNLTSLYLPHV